MKESIEVLTMKVEELSLHPESLTTPVMSEINYEALKSDIDLNGQLEPVTLFRGKIVDGRHRWLILQELGVPTIKVVKLANNTTLAEIRTVVQSKELRRHATPSQLAIRAFRLKVDGTYSSFSDAAKAIGANPKRVTEAKKISVLYGRNDILELLFNGQQFNTGSTQLPFMTDSLGTIIRWLEEHGVIQGTGTQKLETIVPRVELTEDEQILVNLYVSTLKKESELVIGAVANRLYSIIKGQ